MPNKQTQFNKLTIGAIGIALALAIVVIVLLASGGSSKPSVGAVAQTPSSPASTTSTPHVTTSGSDVATNQTTGAQPASKVVTVKLSDIGTDAQQKACAYPDAPVWVDQGSKKVHEVQTPQCAVSVWQTFLQDIQDISEAQGYDQYGEIPQACAMLTPDFINALKSQLSATCRQWMLNFSVYSTFDPGSLYGAQDDDQYDTSYQSTSTMAVDGTTASITDSKLYPLTGGVMVFSDGQWRIDSFAPAEAQGTPLPNMSTSTS